MEQTVRYTSNCCTQLHPLTLGVDKFSSSCSGRVACSQQRRKLGGPRSPRTMAWPPFMRSLLISHFHTPRSLLLTPAGLREDCQCPWDMTVVIAAVRAGSQHVCAWLHASGCPWAATWREWALDTAAEAGHRQLCEWLLTQGCEWCPTAPAAAARHGHVALMHWLCGLHRRDPSRGVHVGELVRGLAYGCGLAELQQGYAEWLDVRGRQLGEWCREGVVAAAAASTTADWRNKVEWLLGNKGYPVAQQACDRAAQCTDAPERLVWLLRRGFRLGRSVVALAASNADGGALAWVVGRLQQQHKQSQLQGVGRSPACSSPQNRQRLPQGVQEAANSRDPDGACACTQSAAVAEQKQIRCEPALSLHGLDAAVTGAAESGHLCALQVLHDHGAHISQEALCAAARAGQLQVVAWVVEALGAQPAAPEEQGREQHQLQQRMLEQQLQLLQRQQEQLLLPHTDVDPGQLVFMPAARQRPQLTAALFRGAAESGRLDLMAWLHARGCPWDQGVFAAAVGTGCTEQIEWLARTGCPIKVGRRRGTKSHWHFRCGHTSCLRRAKQQPRSALRACLRSRGATVMCLAACTVT